MQDMIPIRIYDQEDALNEIERHQLENLIWLCVSPVYSKVKAVKLTFEKVHCDDLGAVFKANSYTELFNGKVLETVVKGSAKNELIVNFGQQLRHDLNSRLAPGTGVVYRLFRWVAKKLGSARRVQYQQSWLRLRNSQA